MYWYICLIASAAIFSLAVLDALILSKLKYKRKRIMTPSKVLIAGTFLSSVSLLIPIYLEKFPDTIRWLDVAKAVLISIQHAIRLFAFDGGYTDVAAGVSHLPGNLSMFYSALGAVLYFFAPMLTFGVILSFFKNALAYRKYLASFWKHTHVFSELNKQSLALAQNILQKDMLSRKCKLIPGALIVFTDVSGKKDEINIELIENAKELGALLFSKDLESIKYRTKHSVRKVSFYLISEDEDEKFRHAVSIMHDYNYKGVELRVFSDNIKIELLLAAKTVDKMKVIRVNDAQSLIYYNLDLNGLRLLQNARSDAEYGKVISVVIAGLGKYGKEMLRALAWFCQIPGYRLKVNAFDKDTDALKKFKALCPELMSDRYNRQNIKGEACYEINIHPGIDVKSSDFVEKLKEIKDATYVFVALGGDDINLEASVKIRSVFSGMIKDAEPDIETVIYNSEISRLMGVKWDNDADGEDRRGVLNHKNQQYNLHMIGDLEHFYSVDTLIDSELIKTVLDKSQMNNPARENDFWKYEYNYRSSIARAIHLRMRNKAGIVIPGSDKPWEDRTKEEKLAVGYMEHLRWNAYMRSEGYSFSGSPEASSRNDLGKLHHNLVEVEALSDDDLKKDS